MASSNQVRWQSLTRPSHSLNNLTADSQSAFNSPSPSLTILNNDYDAFDAILHNIYEKTLQDNWFKPGGDVDSTGVCIRVDSSSFRCFPYENPKLVPFEEGVRRLNVEVAIKIRSASVHAALSRTPSTAREILIDSNTRIQILDDVSALGDAEREQCAAFVRSDKTLVVWAFDIEHVIPLWSEFEEKLIKYIWRTRSTPNRESNAPAFFEGAGGSPEMQMDSLPDLPSTMTSAAPSSIALPISTRISVMPGPFGMEDVDRTAAAKINVNFGFGASSDDGHDEKAPPPSKKVTKKKKSKFWSFLSWWKLPPPVTPESEKGKYSTLFPLAARS